MRKYSPHEGRAPAARLGAGATLLDKDRDSEGERVNSKRGDWEESMRVPRVTSMRPCWFSSKQSGGAWGQS